MIAGSDHKNLLSASDGTRPGAHVNADGTSFLVWAPDFANLHVVIEREGKRVRLALEKDAQGYWRGNDREGGAGDQYLFELPNRRLLPDPASCFQPHGVHGPSECVDPHRYRWRVSDWQRPRWRGQSIYELHVGAFTPEGTFAAAATRLGHVRNLGVEAIQLMPIADFPGRWNWGYDGVALFAPARCYGRPDDLRALVDAAHAEGLAVIFDVVYNHLGPVGNYLQAYCGDYFSPDRHTPWGQAFNFDGPRSAPVRAFVVENAAYWLDEFRVDGLRLDATHAMIDASDRHVLAEIAAAVHRRGGFVLAEDERNSVELITAADRGGLGIDAVWSDDFHHQVRVATTGRRESYFAAYEGKPADLADVLAHGWTYRGQPFPFWQGRRRGAPVHDVAPMAFVVCIENHDQIGNRARGERLEHLVAPQLFRAASLLVCLSPYPPLLFMGQEWSASSPFLFFTDHDGEVGRQVSAGRRREFEQTGLNQGDSGEFPDPQDPATFLSSKLRWEECRETAHAEILALYRAALRERRAWLQEQAADRRLWSVENLGDVVVVRYHGRDPHRLLLVALGPNRLPPGGAEKILQPPNGRRWTLLLHSEAAQFGGGGSTGNGLEAFTGPAAALFVAEEEKAHGIG